MGQVITPGTIEIPFLLRILASDKLFQSDVMRLSEGLSDLDRSKLLSDMKEGCLLQKELGILGEVRSAQIVAALLPQSAEIMLRYLKDSNAEIVFAMICALTDVPSEHVKDFDAEIVDAVAKAKHMPGAEEASVDYIATKYLRESTGDLDEVR